MNEFEYQSEIRNLQTKLGEAASNIQKVTDEYLLKSRAVTHVMQVIEEAIIFTGRWPNFSKEYVLFNEEQRGRADREIMQLNQVFLNIKREAERMLAGEKLFELTERKDYEGIGGNAGEGGEQGNTKKKRKKNSGETAVDMDDTGSKEV